MLQSALLLVAAGSAVAQAYPDQLDTFRGEDTTPQIELVLDTSSSMGPVWGPSNLTSSCNYYYEQVLNNPPSPGNPMTRLNLLKAVLTGCRADDDGILDRWADQAIFAVREFGTVGLGTAAVPAPFRTGSVAGFFGGPLDASGIPIGSNLPNLEAAVLGLYADGWTPMARAYELAARHFGTAFSAANSRSCRQNFIILMTDGEGNMSTHNSVHFDFISGQPNLSISDTDICYLTAGVGCPPGFTPPYADEAASYLVRDSSGLLVDALPLVPDTVLNTGATVGQPIRTYTIGFDAPPSTDILLSYMAFNGEGQYYRTTSYEQLNEAFENIITDIIPRGQVNFNAGALDAAGLFSGNFMYRPTFRPVADGHWFGTIKKHCVMPANAADQTCLFRDDGTGTLVTNTAVVDQWTLTNDQNATVGGTGEQIFRRTFNVTGPTSAVPPNPLNYRRIVTWRPGQTTNNYIRLNGSPSSLDNTDTFTSNLCEHFRLVNKLHGFTDQVTDCAAADYTPVGFDTWPQGDTANGGTVLLRYTDECESPSSRCYVLTNSNDGMLHVFRTRDGEEVSALIPGDLWGTSNVNIHQLKDLMDQPNLDQLRRYYFDGGLRLFHRDDNTNGYIDGAETAYLIAGLGRGGRGYYLWNVTNFFGDFSSSTSPRPHPLTIDQATGFRNLRETWAAPWVGLMRDAGGVVRNVAAFASGHQREFDPPSAAFGVLEPSIPPAPNDTPASPHGLTCTAFGLDPTLCTPPFPPGGCTPCTTIAGCPALPTGGTYCYDWPGYQNNSAAIPFDQGQPTGHDILFGPYSWAQANQSAQAYRVVFSRFELQAGDYMEFLDQNQAPIGRISGNGVGSTSPCSGAVCSPWMYTRTFYVRLVSDGNDSASVRGWDVAEVEVIRQNDDQPARTAGSLPLIVPNYTRPTVYFVDLDEWAALPDYAAPPGPSDTRQRNPLLVRITSDCDGLGGVGEICIDATGSGGQPAQPDLANMTCPISAELSVYQEGDVFRTAYVGDECGQIWKFDQDPGGTWTAQRLLRLNREGVAGRTIPNRRSDDYRKIFTRLELVLSRCNGSRSIGVVFGSGNVQRAGRIGPLSDPSVTRFPGTGSPTRGDFDVIGVVWDSANLTPPPTVGLSLQDLENATSLVEIPNPTIGNAANGYFIELGQSAKMLRAPVVFDGVATFKTHTPDVAPTECLTGYSFDRVYMFDICNAAPIVDTYDGGNVIGDTTTDRITWSGQTDIGGGLLVFTPPDGNAFVSVGDTNATTEARLPGRPNSRAMRMYLWRTAIDL